MTGADTSTPKPGTAGELWHRHTELEREASTLLGGFLFAFSRLEFAVSQAVDSLRCANRLTREPSGGRRAGFFENLNALTESVAAITDVDVQTKKAYAAWAQAAHSLRAYRNAFVHGRWAVDPQRALVLNISSNEAGVPETAEYGVAALRDLAARPAALQRQLSDLRASGSV